MSVRFAYARSSTASPLCRAFTVRRNRIGANDNYCDDGDGALLSAALQLFARHGLRAAEHARGKAEAAYKNAERQQYLWWLGICRTLDYRLACRAERQCGSAVPLI
ncbi:MAG: hypothetical protein WA908_05680 [Pontixanthobacter sp.]